MVNSSEATHKNENIVPPEWEERAVEIIKNRYDIQSNQVYTWVLIGKDRGKASKIIDVVLWAIIGLLLCFVIFLFFWGIGQLLPRTMFVLSFLVAFISFLSWLSSISSIESNRLFSDTTKISMKMIFVSMSLLYIVWYQSSTHFSGNNSSLLNLFLFFIDKALSGLTADLSEEFLVLSDIKPITKLGNVYTAILKWTSTVGIISYLYYDFKQRFGNTEVIGTVESVITGFNLHLSNRDVWIARISEIIPLEIQHIDEGRILLKSLIPNYKQKLSNLEKRLQDQNFNKKRFQYVKKLLEENSDKSNK